MLRYCWTQRGRFDMNLTKYHRKHPKVVVLFIIDAAYFFIKFAL